jgi:hypothetical protein
MQEQVINEDPVERRQHKRVPLDMEIDVCHLTDKVEADLSIISCRGRDVSESGVSFFGETRYPYESVLRLSFPIQSPENTNDDNDHGHLKVMGKVMWCKKRVAEKSYVTGVQFLNIYEKDFQILSDYVQKFSMVSL